MANFNRGDSKSLAFKLRKKGSNPAEYIDGSSYAEVEVQFNKDYQKDSVKKLMSKGEVEWDADNSRFIVYLTQKDTFKLPSGNSRMQVRLSLEDGWCKGSYIKDIDVYQSLSDEVL